MGKAARASDDVAHGGKVLTGSADVFTDKLPTARMTDIAICAKHGIAFVAQSSATVFVNGRGMARLGDGCACASGGAAGPGAKEMVLFILSVHGQKTLDEVMKELKGHSFHLEAIAKDFNQDGALDTVDLKGGLGGFQLGDQNSLATGGLEIGSVEGTFGVVQGPGAITGPGGIPLNTTVTAEGAVSAVRGNLGLNLGSQGSIVAEGGMFNASGGGSFLLGDDGRRVGLVARGGGELNALEGEVVGTQNTTIGGFLNQMALNPLFAPAALATRAVALFDDGVAQALETPLKVQAAIGGDVASVGGSAGIEAYADRVTGQATLGGELDLSFILGASLKLSFVAGKDKSAGGGGAPNVISSGSGNVYVGG